jgi:transposase InsO family protein
MCKVLKVSKSGFYDWCKRQQIPSETEQARQHRHTVVETIFNESKRIYGYRKVYDELRRQGYPYSKNTVYHDCQALNLKSNTRKKYRVKTTDSNHRHPIADNVLCRNFKAQKPNEKWVTDITYVETKEGWLYVTAIIDLFSRKVIGYSMADHMKTQLAKEWMLIYNRRML